MNRFRGALLASLGCVVLTGCGEVALEQTPACASYVACIAAKDSVAGTTTNVARFEPDGACWGFSEAAVSLCDRACSAGLSFVREREPGAPSECQP